MRSDVANRPPSRGTSGLRSGGNTGRTVITIHSGLLVESVKDSSNFRRFDKRLILVSELVLEIASRTPATSPSRSSDNNRSRTASAPMRASNSLPYCSMASRYVSLVRSSSNPIRDGRLFRNQMCATGLASSMCAMRSRRTLVWVTSTPHFSHTTPRCLRRLYFPQRHS